MTKSRSDIISALLFMACSFLAGRASVSVDWPVIPIVTTAPPLASEVPRVLFVYETDDKVDMPRGQRGLIDSAPFRQWLRDQGWEFRFYDQDQTRNVDDEWWFDALKVEPGELPRVYAVAGNSYYAGAWPDDVEAAKAILEGLR